jgi:hypothetical protein
MTSFVMKDSFWLRTCKDYLKKKMKATKLVTTCGDHVLKLRSRHLWRDGVCQRVYVLSCECRYFVVIFRPKKLRVYL